MQKIGIIGPGVMGSSIAYLAASCGFDVVLYGRSDNSLEKGKDRIEKIISGGLKRGKITEKDAEKIREKIEYTTDFAPFVDCDIVIESVSEDMELKKDIFRRVDMICPKRTILATNTSTKSVTEIASVCKHQDRVVGMHFFNPAHIMKLVEVVKAVQTSDEVVEQVKDIAIKLGKIPVVVKDYPGFIVNRLLVPFLNHAIEFLESGIDAETLKKVTTLGLGHPMGPVELADFIGLDVVQAMGETLYEGFKDEKFAPPILLKNLVRAGFLGVKTKRGFLEYDGKK
jgi:3-hydroxybutyryl-CoA dehydrogenase